ncbi:hypothetical protein MHH33_13910 [Paenisporosarcina sp. FSL H8-0542]|uniref:hypothetical protein n=1 Tax=Paenisporosarcina sp. FSL H8-0542 TaxID=2921401 RepID=UPI00315B3AB5
MKSDSQKKIGVLSNDLSMKDGVIKSILSGHTANNIVSEKLRNCVKLLLAIVLSTCK